MLFWVRFRSVDAIVAHIEVNGRHGVGVLLERLFGSSPGIFSIRSQNYFEGRQSFGDRHVCISHADQSRDAVIARVREAAGDAAIDRILCVPYFADDALNALALHEISGAPLCTYLMDDQNLYAQGIPDELMGELLRKSALRLAISEKLGAEYRLKYAMPFAFVPPLAPAELIPRELNFPDGAPLHHLEAMIVGNIWGIRWVQLLREATRRSGLVLRWCNRGEFGWWVNEDMRSDGLILHPEDESDASLVEMLRRAAFAVVPSGTLDDTDDRRFIAQLSLPSRIPFIFATSHAPILVLGNPNTAAARFVSSTGIGIAVPYDADAVQDAVLKLWDPKTNRSYREAAFRLSSGYSDAGAADWIWRSLAHGAPIDDRFNRVPASH